MISRERNGGVKGPRRKGEEEEEGSKVVPLVLLLLVLLPPRRGEVGYHGVHGVRRKVVVKVGF